MLRISLKLYMCRYLGMYLGCSSYKNNGVIHHNSKNLYKECNFFSMSSIEWYIISLNLFYETISCVGRHNVLLLIKYLILYKVKRKCNFFTSIVQSKKIYRQIIHYWKKFQPIVVQFNWKMCSYTFYNLIDKIV